MGNSTRVVDGLAVRLKNRRVKLYRLSNDSWLMVFVRLPQEDERRAGQRVVETSLTLSHEAMVALMELMCRMGLPYRTDKPAC